MCVHDVAVGVSLNPVLVLPGGVSLESSLHDEQSLAELLP